MVSERTFWRSGPKARAQGGSWAVAQAESCASVGTAVGLERRGDVGSDLGLVLSKRTGYGCLWILYQVTWVVSKTTDGAGSMTNEVYPEECQISLQE